MADSLPNKLDRAVDDRSDHILGNPSATITLLEYGSYTCPYCHAAHEVIANLRDHLGDRMRYVFRHRPNTGNADAQRAAELAEFAGATTDRFWPVHDALMKRGPTFAPTDFADIAAEFDLASPDETNLDAWRRAEQRVQDDRDSSQRSGALLTPTFFINGRRYEGAWDENTLTEAMLGSLGHRLQSATLDFVRWGPSTGFLLLVMSILGVAIVNSSSGAAFEAFWNAPLGLQWSEYASSMPLRDWIDHGLLTVFFLVVGLEIKREFTIGHLATRRAAMLPLAAAVGGMTLPALIYAALIPSGPLTAGWGVPIATDTAFAIALIVVLRERVPVELRVFLTAAVIVDDLVAIVVVALFYSGAIDAAYVAAAVAITAALVALNYAGVYRPLPYAVLGVVLWVCLHQAGIHATLAGVILAIVTPTRPPPNLRALIAQADTVMHGEIEYSIEGVLRHGPSEPAMRALDAIHDRIESPADKLLRSVEPWSSYVVLPLFALANAGVVLSRDIVDGHTGLILAIVLGLVLGKPIGIVSAAALAVRLGIATKPDAYSWRQLLGAGALGGIGFTMSLFIADQAFPSEGDFAAAKIAIFVASIVAGTIGTVLLWRRPLQERPT
jgi:Na+:H+ antiporter, NhaA family